MNTKTDFLPSCRRCDDSCCTGDIIVSKDERHRIIKRWNGGDPFGYDGRFDFYYLDIEECPFLNKNGMCSIHDVRPVLCRLYPFSIVPLRSGGFRLQLDKSCSVGTSIPQKEREALRRRAERFLHEIGRETFLAFYEDL